MTIPSRSRPRSRSPWLTREPDPQAAGRIFCIPQAGAGASVFAKWPPALDGVEFLPIELPGRLARYNDPTPESYIQLAQAMAGDLNAWLDRPFGFFGHCWSAIAAYEVTVALEQAARAPSHLYVSAEAPPQWGAFGRMLDFTDEALDQEIVDVVQAMGKTPHPELIAFYRGVLRSDIEMRRAYPARRIEIATPMSGYAWSDDAYYSTAHMEAWAECGVVEVITLPGPHTAFVDAPPPLLSGMVSALLSAQRG